MVNSKRMSKSKVAMIALAILLVLSLILTATGAWFTDTKNGASNSIDGTFGTLTVSLTEANTVGAWEELPVTEEVLVMPGSTFTVQDTAIANTGTVDAYIKVTITNLVVSIAGQPVDQSEYFNSALTLAVEDLTSNADVEAVDGHAGVYLVKVGGSFNVEGGTLTLKDAVQNSDASGTAYAHNGATINISYRVQIAAVQADYIELSELDAALAAAAPAVA